MVKIPLSNQKITIRIYFAVDSEPRVVEIKHGDYNRKIYSLLVVNGENVILDGDEPIILADKAKVVDINIKSIMDIVAETMKSNEVYLKNIDAIPIGEEREVLKVLLN